MKQFDKILSDVVEQEHQSTAFHIMTSSISYQGQRGLNALDALVEASIHITLGHAAAWSIGGRIEPNKKQ